MLASDFVDIAMKLIGDSYHQFSFCFFKFYTVLSDFLYHNICYPNPYHNRGTLYDILAMNNYINVAALETEMHGQNIIQIYKTIFF